MKKSKRVKGFTLIELLAIIVILAIIAVITVPIILNVIDNAKVGSIQDSAYGYKDAVNKFYVSKLSEDTTYDLTGKYTTQQLKEMGVNVSGMEPVDGWVEIEKGVVLDYGLKFDEYIVNYDEATKKPVVTKNGELFPKTYFNDGEVVYFNPVSGEKCTETDYNNNSDQTGTSGCLKWYAFSDADGNTDVNLLLNRNMFEYINSTNTATQFNWCNSEDYSNTSLHSSLGITYQDYNGSASSVERGPVTILKKLKSLTSGWSDILVRSDNYSVDVFYADNTLMKSGLAKYTIDYTGYKARLISAEEVVNLNELQNFDFSVTSYSLNKGWLFSNLNNPMGPNGNCLDYGCEENLFQQQALNSYWTSTATVYSNQYGFYDNRAFVVGYRGEAYVDGITNGYIGIRPVITVPKDLLLD